MCGEFSGKRDPRARPATEVDEASAADRLAQIQLHPDYLTEANELSSNGRTHVTMDAFLRPPSVANAASVSTGHVETSHAVGKRNERGRKPRVGRKRIYGEECIDQINIPTLAAKCAARMGHPVAR